MSNISNIPDDNTNKDSTEDELAILQQYYAYANSIMITITINLMGQMEQLFDLISDETKRKEMRRIKQKDFIYFVDLCEQTKIPIGSKASLLTRIRARFAHQAHVPINVRQILQLENDVGKLELLQTKLHRQGYLKQMVRKNDYIRSLIVPTADQSSISSSSPAESSVTSANDSTTTIILPMEPQVLPTVSSSTSASSVTLFSDEVEKKYRDARDNADRYKNNGQFIQAVRCYNDIKFSLVNNNEDTSYKFYPDVLVALAECYCKLEMYEEAEDEATDVMEQYPSNSSLCKKAFLECAKAQSKQPNQLNKAIFTVNNGLRKFPDDIDFKELQSQLVARKHANLFGDSSLFAQLYDLRNIESEKYIDSIWSSCENMNTTNTSGTKSCVQAKTKDDYQKDLLNKKACTTVCADVRKLLMENRTNTEIMASKHFEELVKRSNNNELEAMYIRAILALPSQNIFTTDDPSCNPVEMLTAVAKMRPIVISEKLSLRSLASSSQMTKKNRNVNFEILEAMRILGRMYEIGDGVTQDLDKADHWYKEAADHGNVYAMLELGMMYYYRYRLFENLSPDLEESGTSSSNQLAKYWFEKFIDCLDDHETIEKFVYKVEMEQNSLIMASFDKQLTIPVVQYIRVLLKERQRYFVWKGMEQELQKGIADKQNRLTPKSLKSLHNLGILTLQKSTLKYNPDPSKDLPVGYVRTGVENIKAESQRVSEKFRVNFKKAKEYFTEATELNHLPSVVQLIYMIHYEARLNNNSLSELQKATLREYEDKAAEMGHKNFAFTRTMRKLFEQGVSFDAVGKVNKTYETAVHHTAKLFLLSSTVLCKAVDIVKRLLVLLENTVAYQTRTPSIDNVTSSTMMSATSTTTATSRSSNIIFETDDDIVSHCIKILNSTEERFGIPTRIKNLLPLVRTNVEDCYHELHDICFNCGIDEKVSPVKLDHPEQLKESILSYRIPNNSEIQIVDSQLSSNVNSGKVNDTNDNKTSTNPTKRIVQQFNTTCLVEQLAYGLEKLSEFQRAHRLRIFDEAIVKYTEFLIACDFCPDIFKLPLAEMAESMSEVRRFYDNEIVKQVDAKYNDGDSTLTLSPQYTARKDRHEMLPMEKQFIYLIGCLFDVGESHYSCFEQLNFEKYEWTFRVPFDEGHILRLKTLLEIANDSGSEFHNHWYLNYVHYLLGRLYLKPEQGTMNIDHSISHFTKVINNCARLNLDTNESTTNNTSNIASSSSSTSTLRASAYCYRAYCRRKQGKIDMCIDDLEKYFEIMNSSPSHHLYIDACVLYVKVIYEQVKALLKTASNKIQFESTTQVVTCNCSIEELEKIADQIIEKINKTIPLGKKIVRAHRAMLPCYMPILEGANFECKISATEESLSEDSSDFIPQFSNTSRTPKSRVPIVSMFPEDRLLGDLAGLRSGTSSKLTPPIYESLDLFTELRYLTFTEYLYIELLIVRYKLQQAEESKYLKSID